MRDQRSQAIAAAFPDQFAALCEASGAAAEYCDDATFRQIANEVALNNAGTIIHGALVADGAGLDFTAVPEMAQKLAKAGVSNRDLREFAAALYPDETADSALRHYQRDILRAAGGTVEDTPTDAAVARRRRAESMFDRPY